MARDIPLTAAALQAGPPFVLDATLEDERLSLGFDGLKRVDGPSKLGDFHYVPMLFHEGRKVGKEQRLLLDVYGLLLSRIQGRMPADGIVWHGKEVQGDEGPPQPDLRKTERSLREVKEIAKAGSPPRLILNDHCQVCEFRQRCHDQAVQEDNLSLLRGIGEKEVKSYARKGIFTLTQLAHTFRPRRKGKQEGDRDADSTTMRLQALAIRDKTDLRLRDAATSAEPGADLPRHGGRPDEGFVYLIGMIVVEGGTETRHSFWADSKEQEARDLRAVLGARSASTRTSSVFCYGGYERAFLKRMRKQAKRKSLVDRVLKALVNVLSLIYSHVYFPCYSNGLKDVAAAWAARGRDRTPRESRASSGGGGGRPRRSEEWKQKLTTYNLEDCAALRRVTELVYAVVAGEPRLAVRGRRQIEGQPVARVQELERLGKQPHVGTSRFRPRRLRVHQRACLFRLPEGAGLSSAPARC